MLTTERQRHIKELALKNGEISIADLAVRFDVSIETIRRDINFLSEKNILKFESRFQMCLRRRLYPC